MTATWDTDIAGLLAELSEVQQQLLGVLATKRQLLAAADVAGLEALRPREQELVDRLQACQAQRGDMLARASLEGLPADSIGALAAALPPAPDSKLRQQVDDARHRTRLLQHQSLTNWVLVQRSLIHLSQLLEIIATSGRPRPTYGSGEPVNSSGSLVDRAA